MNILSWNFSGKIEIYQEWFKIDSQQNQWKSFGMAFIYNGIGKRNAQYALTFSIFESTYVPVWTVVLIINEEKIWDFKKKNLVSTL